MQTLTGFPPRLDTRTYRWPVLSLAENDFTVNLFAHAIVDGKETYAYQLWDGETLIFEETGPAFACPHRPNIEDTIIELLGSLSLQEGDTDAEYFDNYTPAQLEWTRSNRCEELSSLAYDYENPISEEE